MVAGAAGETPMGYTLKASQGWKMKMQKEIDGEIKEAALSVDTGFRQPLIRAWFCTGKPKEQVIFWRFQRKRKTAPTWFPLPA